MSELPLPVPDRDSSPWWEAAAKGRLTVQCCADCSHLRWPAREMCNRCGSLEWSWTDASGRAEVVSWIVNRHAFMPGVETPYVVVVARLAEQGDILVPGAWGGSREGADLSVGAPVRAAFDATDDPVIALLTWRSEESPETGSHTPA